MMLQQITVGVALLHALVDPVADSQEGERPTAPNIVIVFADDLGYGDLSCYGGDLVETPRLDALAREGLRATDFSVTQPVCSASRAALLSGRYPHRIGITGALGPRSPRGMPEEVLTLAELCRGQGYATALFGKWHLGDHEPFLPTHHGFDEWWGIPYSNDMWPRHPESPQHYPPLPLREGDATGERLVEENPNQGRFTTEIAARGAEFIRRSVAADRPFLLYMPHPMPHVPLAASPEGDGRTGRGLYADVIAEIDSTTGTILDTLEQSGVADDTIVIFTSDNGPWISYGDHAGSAGPLREAKGTTFEGGVRVPWIARWPGRFPEGVVLEGPFNAIDMLPTIAEAIGTEAPPEVEGRSVLASLLEPATHPIARGPIFYWYHAPGGGQQIEAVREGRWKLHLPHGYRSMDGRSPGADGRPGKYDYGRRIGRELFDLEADLAERIDVSAEHPEVVERLTRLAAIETGKDAVADGVVWLGPHWQPNRLQDWRRRGDTIECVNTTGAVRTAHRLDLEIEPSLASATGTIATIEVSIEPRPDADGGEATLGNLAFAGLLIGAGSEGNDPRRTALVQQSPGPDGGLIVALDGSRGLHALDFSQPRGGGFRWTLPNDASLESLPQLAPAAAGGFAPLPWNSGETLRLRVEIRRDSDRQYSLHASARTAADDDPFAVLVVEGLEASSIDGGVALVSHRSPHGFAFRDFEAYGSAVAEHPERCDQPILATLYTLDRSDRTETSSWIGADLRVTAQFQPVPASSVVSCRLELAGPDGTFREVARARVDPDSFTATFAARGVIFSPNEPRRFRVVGEMVGSDGVLLPFEREGLLRPEPGPDRASRLALLTCIKHWTGGDTWNDRSVWYPHEDLVAKLESSDPDLLCFAGDQLYEGDLTPAERDPLDYHTKWQRFLRTFGDLLRDRPCVLVTDDHDVYHGNLWGAGGIEAKARDGLTAQDAGGYRMPIAWVNMVHRTQTSHLPATAIEGPIGDGVEPYTTRLVWGPFDLAILADRMWKDSASVKVPGGGVRNGFFTAEGFDPRESGVEDAALLGEAQEAFLAAWAADRRTDAPRRLVLSQSPFVGVHTLPEGKTDAVVPSLAVLDLERGDWPTDDVPAADTDTHGWPKPARDRAVGLLAQGDALHLAGDQHLASLVQYGLEGYRDGPWVLTAPAIANTWPRRWMPRDPGANPVAGMPRGGGDFEDAFGNRLTVWRVANPRQRGVEPARLHDLAPGFALVEFDPVAGSTTVSAESRIAGDPPYFEVTLPELTPLVP
ncbi:MAG: sulfatase-like hydrolase/transferase [Phycisphaerales bacterium]